MSQWQVAGGKWQGKARHGGFTLLELLVALSVFALVSVMAYGGLRAVLDARAHTERVSRDLAELQVALTLLGRDLSHLVARPVRDVHGDPQAPLRFNAYADRPRLELVRTSATSGLQRIAWELEGANLYRLAWAVIDGADPELPQERLPVIGPPEREQDESRRAARDRSGDRTGGVREWRLRFHYPTPDGTYAMSESWPLEISPGSLESLPVALELTLEVDGVGPVTRWMALQ